MKKIIFAILILAALVVGFLVWLRQPAKYASPIGPETTSVASPNGNNNGNASGNVSAPTNTVSTAKPFVEPVADARSRITKKPFGIYVTPQASPVQPERFRGYHTGTDFETFPNELNQEVVVHAICDGKIIVKRWASGYGNVMVESCVLDGQPVTVVYGHLSFSGSVSVQLGSSVSAGEPIAVLGAAYSHDTDGERKHLHLGIHKGTEINILGYVQAKSQLAGWFNAEDYINFQ